MQCHLLIDKVFIWQGFTVICQFAPSQLVQCHLVPDNKKKETCPRLFDILVEHNVDIKMKDIFVEQLSLKQNAESLKHVLNQNEFKACMNQMKATNAVLMSSKTFQKIDC